MSNGDKSLLEQVIDYGEEAANYNDITNAYQILQCADVAAGLRVAQATGGQKKTPARTSWKWKKSYDMFDIDDVEVLNRLFRANYSI